MDAASTTFDQTTGESVLSGRASLVDGSTTLRAEEIRFNLRSKTAVAKGNVILQQDRRRVLADELIYRLTDKSFDVRGLKAGLDPVYLSASEVSGSAEAWLVKDATATFREPGPWTPTLEADAIVLRVDRSAEMTDGRLGIGSRTVLPLPGFPIPVDEIFVRYLTLGAGYRRSLGAFFELGANLPVAPGFELGGNLGYYSNRGVLAGPSGRYRKRAGLEWMKGEFTSGFIHDSGDKLRDVLNLRVPEDRAFFHWTHRQHLSERLSLVADVDYWSDSEVLRDFRPKEFYPVQQPDTFIQADYTGTNYVLNGFARTNLNRFFEVQERLPEFTFALLPQLLGSEDLGLYQRGQASISRLRQDAAREGRTLRSDRLDMYYALTRPVSPREWLSVRPVTGVRFTHYARTNMAASRDSYSRTLGEVGVDADLRVSATYDYRNPAWKVNGLRHLLTPRLSYRYIPKADKGRGFIPQIDRRSFSTYLQPLGLGDQRNIDDLDATHALRIQFNNTLQTRDNPYGSRDLVQFNVAADHRFKRPQGGRSLSDLHAELSLTPTAWLRFDVYQRFSTESGRLKELNTGLTLANSEWWSIRLGTHYLEENIEEYVADGTFRLNEVYEAFVRMHYDSRQARFVQQTYGIHHTLDNLWVLSYGFNFYEGRRREGSFGFVVEVEAARF